MSLSQSQEARGTAAEGPGETRFVDTRRTSRFVGTPSDSQLGDTSSEDRP